MPSLYTRTTETLWALLDPWLFLSISLRQIPPTIHILFRTHPPIHALRTIFTSQFRDLWFSHFWALVGPGIREDAGQKVLPLLDGRTMNGTIVDHPVREGIGGVVIEIGAGSGLWVDVFSDAHLHTSDSNTARTPITKIYGIEPNPSHHPSLRRNISRANLSEIYEIVPVGIEHLHSSSDKKWQGNIEKGSIDCIVSLLCLCSIPEPERHTRELYELLKPGGRWFVYEHVRVTNYWWLALYQRFINLVWPTLIGGCEICRPTEQTLRNAGSWSSVDIGQPPVEPWYHLVPHILGVFTK
ncbi:S-adenosyl-L-methionine-dependent methyltransferase [Xylariaceae sp. FL1019]|nr:S-adenosyl-L-methionine-dependent methyltransferase [Xylariaceae sp. FL1019]